MSAMLCEAMRISAMVSTERATVRMEQFGATVAQTAANVRQAMALVGEAASTVSQGGSTFRSDDREAFAVLTGARRLNRSVERQNIGLEGNRLDYVVIASSIDKVAAGHALSEQTRDAMSHIVSHIEQVKTMMAFLTQVLRRVLGLVNHVAALMGRMADVVHRQRRLTG
jgi:methyl-accepting chemotaxis protein